MNQVLDRLATDVAWLSDSHVPDLLPIPVKDSLQVGKQNAELERQVDAVSMGEDATEVTTVRVTVANRMPDRISQFSRFGHSLPDQPTQLFHE